MIARFCLVLGSVVFAFVAAEFILRASGRLPSQEPRTVSEEAYGRVPGMWEPGQSLVSRGIPELPHHVSINSFGFRGPEPESDWDEQIKVLVVGDSFTFGSYVDDADTLPAQLSAGLPQEEFEVFNAGLGGSTIIDQIHFLEKALSVDPDIVVLVYSENDLDDLYSVPPLYKQLEKNRELKSGLFGFGYTLVRDTCLFNLFLRARAALRNRTTKQEKTRIVEDRGSEIAKGRGLIEYRRYFDRFEKIVSESGAELLFVLYPSHHSLFDKDKLLTIPMVKKAVPAEKVLDLTEPLANSGSTRRDLFLLPHDGHPTAKGYAIAAKVLIPAIQEMAQR